MHPTTRTNRPLAARISAATLFAFSLGFAGSAIAGGGGGGGNTTAVCHVSGNGTVSQLNINQSAISSHLAHGDFLPLDFYADVDGDGYGDPNNMVSACTAPSGTVANADDCDDQDAAVNPGAGEICDDGVDNNCDGQIDEGCDLVSYGECPIPTEFTTCTIDLSSGAFVCDNGTPLSLLKFNAYGPVYTLDMSDWDVAIVDVDVRNPDGYWLHLGNSRTNNGWSGDSGQTSNDSEAQLRKSALEVFRSDKGGSSIAQNQTPTVDPAGDAATMVV